MGKFIVSGTGNLTKDAVIREISGTDGKKSQGVEISVAANNSIWKNGQWNDEPVFVTVKYVASADAKTPAKLLKGSTVSFYGVLHRETWVKDGVEKSRDVVRAEHVEIINAKPADGSKPAPAATPAQEAPAQKVEDKPAPAAQAAVLADEEIPF